MPLATIKVMERVFSEDEKRQMIEKVTEALVAVEGEDLRDKTVVVLEEVKSGGWGIGGGLLKTADAQMLRSGMQTVLGEKVFDDTPEYVD